MIRSIRRADSPCADWPCADWPCADWPCADFSRAQRLSGIVRGRCGDESGFAGGLDGLVFGLLVFVVGTLLAGNAWAVVDTKLATDAAARQAVRTYVEAPNAQDAATGAQQSADDALAGYGRSPSKASLSVDSSVFGRCERVTIEVHYRAPLVELPFLGRVGLAEAITAQHSELVDPYRSGLPGSAACA